MFRFPNGIVLAGVASRDSCPIWDVIVKKNLLPSLATLSTHVLPPIRETRHFEMDSPRPTPSYSFREKSGLLAEEQISYMRWHAP
jgi:hypothetical protein